MKLENKKEFLNTVGPQPENTSRMTQGLSTCRLVLMYSKGASTSPLDTPPQKPAHTTRGSRPRMRVGLSPYLRGGKVRVEG